MLLVSNDVSQGSFPPDFPVAEESLSVKVARLQGKNIRNEIASGKFCYLDFHPLLGDSVAALDRDRAAKKHVRLAVSNGMHPSLDLRRC